MLTSPKSVHCCDAGLSVLVMLVSRNVIPVVSALQSIVFIDFFLLIKVFCRSYVGSVYRTRSLAVCVTHSQKMLIWVKETRQFSCYALPVTKGFFVLVEGLSLIKPATSPTSMEFG